MKKLLQAIGLLSLSLLFSNLSWGGSIASGSFDDLMGSIDHATAKGRYSGQKGVECSHQNIRYAEGDRVDATLCKGSTITVSGNECKSCEKPPANHFLSEINFSYTESETSGTQGSTLRQGSHQLYNANCTTGEERNESSKKGLLGGNILVTCTITSNVDDLVLYNDNFSVFEEPGIVIPTLGGFPNK